MKEQDVAKNLRSFLFMRGAVTLSLAFLLFFYTRLTFEIYLLLIGASVMILSFFNVFEALVTRKNRKKWPLYMLQGLLGIMIGSIIIFWPEITTVTVVYFIAFWVIVSGFLTLITSFVSADTFGQWLLMAVGGLISVLFGLILFAKPLGGLLVLLHLIALFMAINGMILLYSAWKFRD